MMLDTLEKKNEHHSLLLELTINCCTSGCCSKCIIAHNRDCARIIIRKYINNGVHDERDFVMLPDQVAEEFDTVLHTLIFETACDCICERCPYNLHDLHGCNLKTIQKKFIVVWWK